jgi:hypothetical protein
MTTTTYANPLLEALLAVPDAVTAAQAFAAQSQINADQAEASNLSAGTQAGLAQGYVVAATGQAAISTQQAVLAQGYAANAQAIAAGTFVDANNNVVVGTNSMTPTGGTDGGSIAIGQYAGYGTTQTYTRKIYAFGIGAGAYHLGYASIIMGAYTGTRSCADQAVMIGTHSAQDFNASGQPVYGFGTRATGTLTVASQPADGETLPVNGITLTARTAPATAYEYAIGASLAATTANLYAALLALTDSAILMAHYGMASATATAINVMAVSISAAGNAFTLAASSAGAITVSGGTLTGGVQSTSTGVATSYPGHVGLGWGTLYGSMVTLTSQARTTLAFSANPADGDYVLMGYGLTKTINFKAAPSGALDVQIGASVAATIANAVALLNASTDTTIALCSYWANGNGLMLLNKTVNSNTFEVLSKAARSRRPSGPRAAA